MGIQEVQGAKEAQTFQKRKRAGGGEGFQESLLQNLKSKGQRQEKTADSTRSEKKAQEPPDTGRIGVTGGVRVNAAMLTGAVQTVKVRHMRYEESDYVEIAVTEGYTLKGKRLDGVDSGIQQRTNNMTGASEMEPAEGQTGSRVYVEAKYDDGRTEAYRVEMDRVSQDTTHTIERFALETMREA